MKLSEYQAPRADVPVGNDKLSVRGLSLEDVTRLVSLHMPDIEAAYTRFNKMKEDIYSRRSADEFFIGLATDFPLLVAEVISVAADEPVQEGMDGARRLPLTAQVQCLLEISRLTFEDAGGIKNWFAMLGTRLRTALPAEALEALASLMSGREAKLRTSIGDSAGT